MQNPSPQKTLVDPRFATCYEGRNGFLDPLITADVQFAMDVGL